MKAATIRTEANGFEEKLFISETESHPREWVDGSSPAYETKRPSAFQNVVGFMYSSASTNRLDLNNPPTCVGKIPKIRNHFRRSDLKNPPTSETCKNADTSG